MKSKHKYNKSHKELFLFIQKEINSNLSFCPNRFRRKIGFKGLIYLVLTIVTYLGIYKVDDSFSFIGIYVLYGLISLLFAFNFAHDFSHNTIFKSKKLNHSCFVLLYTMVGAHAEAWKDRHVKSHHHAPNVEGYDTDLEITNLIRVVPESPVSWFHQFQHWYAPFLYTTYSLFWVFVKDFKIFFNKTITGRTKTIRYKISFWGQKFSYVNYVLVLPLLLADKEWYIILGGFLLMHMVQSLFLLFTFFMTHHIEGALYPKTDNFGFINTSWFMNQIQSSNDFYPFSNVANFIFGGFNNHIAHHLFPHIHHIYYPSLNKILYKILMDNNIQPNQTTYVGGIISHLLHLKQLGKAY
ncbi:fatty acid desaturase family protein [Aquimarina sp. 2201CG14-23]|uniref:fatty acid desaturase family protein n=1 Tax=Aquimarina mycalae TaxID=3040073 RepID=UPI002477DF42|nr:fatty acid desaturase [Aquimarina sp. 2201CG14-23]MDH7445119.1 fatty acid desaturase [Aquimarina sp. 2201CG14-23]